MKQLVRNGTIITGARRASAMAIDDGAIVALGDDALDWTSRFDETIDLAGGTAIPGFRDGHAHPLSGGTKTLMLSLFGCGRSTQIQRAVREWAVRPSRRHLDRGQRLRPHVVAGQRRRGRVARRRGGRPAGRAALDRLPHDVGELTCARAGGHHGRHARPRARHHRAPCRPQPCGHAVRVRRDRPGRTSPADDVGRRAAAGARRGDGRAHGNGIVWAQDAVDRRRRSGGARRRAHAGLLRCR